MSTRPARTSSTHPLRIDAVSAPGGGRIGLTLCPGKKQPEALTGPWDRDLDSDLDEIDRFDPAAVVTLMETEELAGVSVPAERLGRSIRERGAEWFHLPIVDVSVPDAVFERDWRHAGPRIRWHLRHGRSVVLHCRGGLGRTGTIAARLLVESGVEPEAAVHAVRDARPGTIETPGQEAHVRASRVPDVRRERVAGCLLAGAIGDALGSPVEFLPLADIRAEYGPEGIREFPSRGDRTGQVTDDTQMALFTAEGLALGLRDPDATLSDLTESVWRAYLRWLETQGVREADDRSGWLLEVPGLHEPRAPGATCLSALLSGRMGEAGAPLNDSKGCGGVMRVAPVGLIAGRLPSLVEVFSLGAATAAITHGHPSGFLSAGFTAVLVALQIEGVDLRESLDRATGILTRHPDHEETLASVTAARELAERERPTPEEIERLGGGWVGEEALAIALAAALAADGLEDALRIAVNHGGDSDSTGAIVGNLLGARLGAGALPARFVERVEFRDVLLRTAEEIEKVSGRLPS